MPRIDFRSLVLIALLGLPTSEVLTQLVITASTFESFEQILAIHILYNRSLGHICQTLEDTTAADASIFVDIDYSIALTNIASFNACSLLSTGLHTWYVVLLI